MARGKHVANRCCCRRRLGPQFSRYRYDSPPLRPRIEQRAFRNRPPCHGLQAQRLPGELDIVAGGDGGRFVTRTVLVLHRVRGTVGLEFHHVALAYQPQHIMEHRQRALHAQTCSCLHTGHVYHTLNRLAPQCVHILLERLLQMDEATLARAVTPVLEGGEGDGFHIR